MGIGPKVLIGLGALLAAFILVIAGAALVGHGTNHANGTAPPTSTDRTSSEAPPLLHLRPRSG
jgi:hypothetical protein